MGCCQQMSQNYVTLLNGLVGAAGVVILGYSAYLSSELKDLEEVYEEFLIYGPVVFGVFLVLIALFGYLAARWQNKLMLLVYLGVTAVVTAFVFGTGIALLVYSGELDEVQDARVQDASSGVVERINDFELLVFNKCCAEAFGLTEVEACEDVNDPNAVCIVDPLRFDDTIANAGDQICNALAEVDVNGAPVVGDPAVNNGCGNGDPALFVDGITQYLIDNVKPLGVINLVLAIVLLLDLLATCVLLWTNKPKAESAKNDEPQTTHKNGPEVAGGP